MPKGSGKPIPRVEINLEMSPDHSQELIEKLKDRFEKHMERHQGLTWSRVKASLESHPEKLASLHAMEFTGGEPDVVGYDDDTEEFIFIDCSEQSPAGRRSICYDEEGEQERVKHGLIPGGNAMGIALEMGIEVLDEDQYRQLQEMGEFDTKTQSWLRTPDEIREQGGAFFAERRYNLVFVGHNTAPSFYSGRGFRGLLKV